MNTYIVVRRSRSSWSPVTGEYEALEWGGEYPDAHPALVEVDARNLLIREGDETWAAEVGAVESAVEAMEELDELRIAGIDGEYVYDYLIQLGVSEAEAARLTA